MKTALITILIVLFIPLSANANLLVNPSFESTGAWSTSSGHWDIVASGDNGIATPYGDYMMKYSVTSNVLYTGFSQGMDATPNATYSISGYYNIPDELWSGYHTYAYVYYMAEGGTSPIKIESVGSFAEPTDGWLRFTASSTAPSEAVRAVLTVAVGVSGGYPDPSGEQVLYWDNFHFTEDEVIPEASSLTLLSVGIAGLILFSRMKRI
ncbi:MAG: hypothetical protein JW728_03280 [Candidatus Aureabacteria bacterium]|nr:hypothetical protein [Candidatus Auribacterota bacterium]